MRRTKALLAVILAALWLPVTMHCGLEALPGLEFLVCCDHEGTVPHEDDDCAADACATVESGFYKLQDHEDVVIASDQLVSADHVVRDIRVSSRVQVSTDSVVGWQFACRAAPLPRAPSSPL